MTNFRIAAMRFSPTEFDRRLRDQLTGRDNNHETRLLAEKILLDYLEELDIPTNHIELVCISESKSVISVGLKPLDAVGKQLIDRLPTYG